MKQLFRYGTFETNSSSMHSMVIVPKKYVDKWKSGQLYVLLYPCDEDVFKANNDKDLFTEEFLKDYYEKKGEKFDNEDDFQEFLYDEDFRNVNNWYPDLERDNEDYVTESGDEITIFCAYGYDG